MRGTPQHTLQNLRAAMPGLLQLEAATVEALARN